MTSMHFGGLWPLLYIATVEAKARKELDLKQVDKTGGVTFVRTLCKTVANNQVAKMHLVV